MVMIAQIQNLRSFVQTQLADVVDPSRHVREDQDKRSTGDQAFVEIKTAFNTYKISVASAYVTPPEGAPLACRSLGTVTFIDMADNKRIVGPKADATWTDISRHIHLRELGDALADCRRKLAEAAPHEAAAVRAQFAEVAAKARKWGIEAHVPDAPVVAIASEGFTENETAKLPPDAQPAAILGMNGEVLYRGVQYTPPDPDRPAPFIGAPVLWITNPGEGIGGMTEIPGFCAKVISADRISMLIFPDHSETSYRDNLMRRGSDAGNGRVHQYNCWDFNPRWLWEQERISMLADECGRLRDECGELRKHFREAVDKLSEEGNGLAGRVIALEAAKPSGDNAVVDNKPAAEAPAKDAGKRRKA